MNDSTTLNAGSLRAMVRHLYETRKAVSEAKKERAALAARLGKCNADMPEDTACYLSHRSKDLWCEVCKAKLPVWEDYRRKVTAAATALRAVIRAGKQMSDQSVRTFSKQHLQCRQDGTKTVMTAVKFEALPPDAQREAELHREFWGALDYTGLGFCGMQPGICGSKHCRKIGNLK